MFPAYIASNKTGKDFVVILHVKNIWLWYIGGGAGQKVRGNFEEQNRQLHAY